MHIPVGQYLDLLRSYLRPQWPQVLGLAALLCAGIGLQLANPQIIRYFIDTAQVGGARDTLLQAAALFAGIVVVGRIIALATTYTSETVAWSATNHLRTDLTRHVLHLDLAFHNEHTPGELVERIDGDVDRLANFFSELVLEILGGVLLAAGVLALLFREDRRIGLVMAIFAIAYGVLHTRGQQLAVPAWRQDRQYAAELAGFVGERVSAVKDIQTNGAIAYTLQRFHAVLRQRLWQALKADVITDAGWTMSKIFFDLGTVGAMGLGAYFFRSGHITIGSVYLVIYYLGMLNGPLNRIARQMEDLQQVRASIERVSSLTATQSTVDEGGTKALPSGGPLSLAMDGVSFGYGHYSRTLHDISFQLPAGQVLGLLGRTGSGKTTLTRLLFRLYDADAGTIALGGVDIRQVPLAGLRRRVGLVTQEVQLFQATVRDNLTLFDSAIPDSRILVALETLGLDVWVRGLPDGLDTELAADSGLSAGEAQLLALARAFLQDPGLVILDEASSRLDPATERLLEQAMDRLLDGRTAIIIAHRLVTVGRADQILILEDGRTLEYGQQQALAERPDSAFSALLRTDLQGVLA